MLFYALRSAATVASTLVPRHFVQSRNLAVATPSVMTLKLYYDAMSQPSRALLIFLRHTQLSYEDCSVALRKGEHLTDDFKEANRFQRVPAIDHNGFKLSESVAIFQYLSDVYGGRIPDHWFPKDNLKRARVREFMAWQHLDLRLFGSFYFRKQTLGMNIPFTMDQIDKQLSRSLTKIQDIYLAESMYLNGADDVTIADLLCCCEMEQPMISGYDLKGRYPKLAIYMDRVRLRLNPIYEQVHQVAHSLRDKVAAAADGGGDALSSKSRL